MEENERLKQCLNQAMKDYQTLQKKFHEISQQDSKQSSDNNQMATLPTPQQDDDDDDDDLVSLSLGRSSSLDSKKPIVKTNYNTDDQVSIRSSKSNDDDEEAKERSLDLGLECKFEVSSNGVDHVTKDGDEGVVKNDVTNNNNGGSGDDDEVGHQPPMKKARVSVRVRCDGPTVSII